jgi:DNA-directed RNA polymerase subunit RPC12/RpoP
VTQSPSRNGDTYDVVCPHCGKTFEGELLSGAAPRYQGFKCPHCRLFVAYERADEQDLVEPPPRP